MNQVAWLSKDAAVAVDRAGGVVRFRVPSAEVVWRFSPRCTFGNAASAERIRLLAAVDGDVYIGCAGGKLIRLAGNDGRLLAERVVAPIDHFTAVRRLPNDTLSIEGMSSGASLRAWLTLVHRADLKAIVQPRQDTQFVGLVGATAVLDDVCCFGRAATYRPATIIRVDLRAGTVLPPVDLRPDATKHPLDRLPLGIGWNAATIAGNDLLLAVTPTLYDYGDPRRLPREPVRLVSDLATLPTFFGNGTAFISHSVSGGALSGGLVDLSTRPIRTRRVFALQYPPVIGRDPVVAQAFSLWTSTSGVIGSEFVRTIDGAVIVPPSGCELVASTHAQAFALCTARAVSTIRQYLGAFTFPAH